MLRIAVRVLGIWLIVFGAGVWVVSRASESKAAPHPPVPNVPSHISKSKVELSGYRPDKIGFTFNVELLKNDGWFDTGIPVTPGLQLWVTCPLGTPMPPNCPRFVQAKIGETTIPSVATTFWGQGKPHVLRAFGEFPPAGELTVGVANERSIVKLRILPKADRIDASFAVSLNIIPSEETKGFTPLQKQLQEELEKRIGR